MQCGVACLAMICRFFGKKYSTRWLEQFCHVGPDGASMKAIADGASTIGLKAVAARLTCRQIMEAPLPAVLHWNGNHFVVLYGISRDEKRFYIADPAHGRVILRKEEFLEHLIPVQEATDEEASGVCMFFEPLPNFGKLEEPKGFGKSGSKTYIDEIRKHRRPFLHALLSLLISGLLQLAVPFLTQATVDIGINQGRLNFIWLVLIGEFIIILARTITDFLRRWIIMHVSARVNISLLSLFLKKLMKLPMGYFDVKLFGDLIRRMGDNSRIQSFITSRVTVASYSLMMMIIFGIALCIFNSWVFLIYAVSMSMYALWMVIFLKKRRQLDYDVFNAESANQGKTYELISSMQEIKLQGCEDRRRKEWEDIQGDLFVLQMKATRLSQNQETGTLFINEIKNALITVVTATSVIAGDLSFGGMLAIQYIVGQLNSPVLQMLGLIYDLQDVGISMERLADIHSEPNEDFGREGKCQLSGKKELTLERIGFKYDPHAIVWTLEGLSCHIPQGKVTAIVGHSGSGKSTLLKLLLGYYLPLEGEIRLGDLPLNDHSMKWWRSRCGVVMQDGVIFSESIAENIAVGEDIPDTERVIEAAKIARIDEFVESLPLGYTTKVGRDGIALSQGQKQRLLIARAVYKNPDFIFFDEATNSLDTVNERKIVDALADFFAKRTVVIVAHRLSTIRNADNILVMSKGRIVESGCHEDLLAAKGEYYNLIRGQMQVMN